MLPKKMSLNDFTFFLAEKGFLETNYLENNYYSRHNKKNDGPILCIKQARGDSYFESVMCKHINLEQEEYPTRIDDALEMMDLKMDFLTYKKLMKEVESTHISYQNDPYDEDGSHYYEEFLPVDALYSFLVERNLIEYSDDDLYKQKEGLTYEKFMEILRELANESDIISIDENGEDLTIYAVYGKKSQGTYQDNKRFFEKLDDLNIKPRKFEKDLPGLIYFSHPSFSFRSSNWTDGMCVPFNCSEYGDQMRYANAKVLYTYCLNVCDIPFPEMVLNKPEPKKSVSSPSI